MQKRIILVFWVLSLAISAQANPFTVKLSQIPPSVDSPRGSDYKIQMEIWQQLPTSEWHKLYGTTVCYSSSVEGCYDSVENEHDWPGSAGSTEFIRYGIGFQNPGVDGIVQLEFYQKRYRRLPNGTFSAVLPVVRSSFIQSRLDQWGETIFADDHNTHFKLRARLTIGR